MLLLLAALAFAFDRVDQVDSYKGCVILIGAPNANGIQPLRAECHWDDVTAAGIHAALSRYVGYGRFISCIKEERIVHETPARTVVWQYDEPGWGLAPRESQIQIRGTAESGFRVAWSDAEEGFTPRKGSVVMPRNEGVWLVSQSPGGGVDVVQELLVDPGGRVPTWVVNWFQTFGMSDALKRLHALAAA